MIDLILAIACSALISILMRLSESHSQNRLSMLAMNYLTCSMLAWMYLGETSAAPAGAMLRTVGLGAVCGVLFLAAFLLLQWNISKNGVVLPSTFMKLGVLVPTVLAVTVFGESPRLTQLLGLLIAVGAIFLIQGGGRQSAGSVSGLIALLLVGGLADAMAKIYEQFGEAAHSNHYLLYTFATALVLCVALCLAKRQGLKPADALFGVAVAVPNYFSTKFLLASLDEVPAVVAYPTFSVGTIVLVTAAGALLFRERLEKRKLIALGMILAALVLLNV